MQVHPVHDAFVRGQVVGNEREKGGNGTGIHGSGDHELVFRGRQDRQEPLQLFEEGGFHVDQLGLQEGTHLAFQLPELFERIAVDGEINAGREEAFPRLLQSIPKGLHVLQGGFEHGIADQPLVLHVAYLGFDLGGLFAQVLQGDIGVHRVHEYGYVEEVRHVDDRLEPARGQEPGIGEDEERLDELIPHFEMVGVHLRPRRGDYFLDIGEFRHVSLRAPGWIPFRPTPDCRSYRKAPRSPLRSEPGSRAPGCPGRP